LPLIGKRLISDTKNRYSREFLNSRALSRHMISIMMLFR